MSNRRRVRACVARACLVAALLLPATAHADAPPPPGYVEKCAVEYQQQTNERCEVCGGAYHGDVEACAKKYAGTELARRCRTRGASVWDELWCRPLKPGENASPVPKAPPAPGLCAFGIERRPRGAAAVLVALLGLALAARRRG